MHTAPPVRIDLAPDRAAGWVVLVLAAIAAANAALWLGALADWRGTPLACAGLVAALAAAAVLRGRPLGCSGVLTWDGSAWLWRHTGDARVVVPRVTLDLGGWILLRVQACDGDGDGEGMDRWAVLTQTRAAGAWSAWRAALLSSAVPASALARKSA